MSNPALLRDEWCTPQWLTEALGAFELDPCSNSRSTVETDFKIDHSASDIDGLDIARHWPSKSRTFVNPPYSRGQVIKWIRAYAHTEFTFLLRWDPSTEWHRLIVDHASWVWFPDRRIDFVPPPGIKASTNPFPHALYFKRAPSREVCDRLDKLGRFYEPSPRSY